MRPGQQNKRGRGRNNNNNNSNNNNNNNHRKGGNPLTRTYDSSGPDVKIRGTAQHVAEKYAALARDAQSSGDRVMAENYLQHAEHYNRIILSAQAQMQERYQRDDRGNDFADRDGFDRDEDGIDTVADEPVAPVVAAEQPQPAVIDGSGPQPVIEGTPAEVSMEEEASAGTAPRGQQSRRRNASRPRRTRRGEGQQAGEDQDPAGDQPILEAASE
ncbi:DUF4167 domain-containing protein [Rhizobium sp. TRM95111]|uniref:DUF4167 domain-containing protein n=1 Tax=Rhizobium alarense TaxID=2846851 RepID=UPI001F2F23CF|nr:DUF4167 domain-containing protein [Rhizobium alarense]MCF3642188.1 DUF4167 domain-containing protein [Rhizobium alarense]